VADEDWLYATTFSVAHLDEVFCGSRIADLQFDGLDTFCTVYLVNVSIRQDYNINNRTEWQCSTANRQYVPLLQRMYDPSVRPPDAEFHARPSSVRNISPRTTTTYWYCGFLPLRKLPKIWKQSMVPPALAPATLATLLAYMYARLNTSGVGTGCGHLEPVAISSSNVKQGPGLLSAGPYRPITLRTYINHLASVTTHACVSADLNFSFALDISLSSANGSNIQDGTLKVHVTLRDANGTVVKEEWVKVHSVEAGTEIKDFIDWILEKDEVALWWPVGYGDQVLYEVEIVLMDAKVIVLIYPTTAATDRV